MNVYYCSNFKGHYPVSTCAIIVAKDKRQARRLLLKDLEAAELPQDEEKIDIHLLETETPGCVIVNTGDY